MHLSEKESSITISQEAIKDLTRSIKDMDAKILEISSQKQSVKTFIFNLIFFRMILI